MMSASDIGGSVPRTRLYVIRLYVNNLTDMVR